MKRALLCLAALGAAPLLAQREYRPFRDYRRHYLSVGAGAAQPGADIKPLLANSPLFRFTYGYRFHRYFQAESGLDSVFYAAKVRDFYESRFGDLRIRDYQFMWPSGGRAIVPLAGNKLLLSAGGGGAYLRYQERIRQPFGDSLRLDCPVCAARSGWGYYGLLGASVALDRAQQLRLGVSTRVVRGDTRGDPFGNIPGTTTKDTWINSAVEFTFSF
ncbi:MAG: hypothetical protein FJW39_06380 [Acidobacteria bacterium]|nr:hypothetical protein [Acidobacteriota bacterium]